MHAERGTTRIGWKGTRMPEGKGTLLRKFNKRRYGTLPRGENTLRGIDAPSSLRGSVEVERKRNLDTTAWPARGEQTQSSMDIKQPGLIWGLIA